MHVFKTLIYTVHIHTYTSRDEDGGTSTRLHCLVSTVAQGRQTKQCTPYNQMPLHSTHSYFKSLYHTLKNNAWVPAWVSKELTHTELA